VEPLRCRRQFGDVEPLERVLAYLAGIEAFRTAL
jgi:hypothetical protein